MGKNFSVQNNDECMEKLCLSDIIIKYELLG